MHTSCPTYTNTLRSPQKKNKTLLTSLSRTEDDDASDDKPKKKKTVVACVPEQYLRTFACRARSAALARSRHPPPFANRVCNIRTSRSCTCGGHNNDDDVVGVSNYLYASSGLSAARHGSEYVLELCASDCELRKRPLNDGHAPSDTSDSIERDRAHTASLRRQRELAFFARHHRAHMCGMPLVSCLGELANW